LPSRLLTVYLFAVILVSGVWIGTPALFPLTWIVVLAVGVLTQVTAVRLSVPDGAGISISARDAMLTFLASAPAFIYLAVTWHQEFPYLGDQWLHNAGAIEAYAFWWPWRWIAAAIAIAVVVWPARRSETSPAALIALALVCAAGLAEPSTLSFAGRYPGTLHFFSIPLRAVMQVNAPLNVERLLNVLSIPVWLLVLRPRILRRHVDISAMTIAVFLFWQKDNIYYFTSGYLEPWAIVLLLTAAEHLIVFGEEAVWRPLLLIGLAAMVKEQLVLSLPIVAAVYFPLKGSRRQQMEHLLTSGVAVTPFFLLWRAREAFKTWGVASPVASAFSAEHAALFRSRVGLQFGAAMPLVIAGFVFLIVLAMRRPAFLALLLVAAADGVVIYFASILQPWAGYPRLNLVPIVAASLALGCAGVLLARQSRVAGAVLVLLTAALNGVVMVPAMRDAFRPSSARSFIEHFDAPLFFPIRQSLNVAGLPEGSRIDILTNGKRIFQFFWAGPLEDQYPDLTRRYRLRSASFSGDASRCRCTDPSIAKLAVFIRFTNLGEHIPERAATEAEAGECAAELRRTCARTTGIMNDGVMVGMLGKK
jgi:hypothetical protein